MNDNNENSVCKKVTLYEQLQCEPQAVVTSSHHEQDVALEVSNHLLKVPNE